jgi:hypothetical protein
MHGPNLRNAYGSSAVGTEADTVLQFLSAILASQDRRPPGRLHEKLSADSWLDKNIRASYCGKHFVSVNRPAIPGRQ